MDNILKLKLKLKNLPATPGVYYFYNQHDHIIYVGKAASLKNRVKSYFIGVHDNKTTHLVSQITNLKYRITDSVIEALILEANEIKRLKPKYNILLKDDKSFAYIFLTREDFPRLFVDRITSTLTLTLRECQCGAVKVQKFGPFTEGGSAQKALEILRRIFGFRDCNTRKFNLYKKKNQPCLFGSIKLCPAPCVENISKDDYKKIIHEIVLFLSGKKKTLITRLKKQMVLASRHQEFELASKIRDKVFALEHIQDVALIKEERPLEQLRSIPHRIEAYDISNLPAGRQGLSGQFATGSMVVFTDGVMDKKEYRKFRIKYCSPSLRGGNPTKQSNNNKIATPCWARNDNQKNDPTMLAQVVARRLNHPEWPMPDLILLDGGKGQLSAVMKILKNHRKKIPMIALAKGPTRKGFRLFRNTNAKNLTLDKKLLEYLRDEAHRFAISYHRKLRTLDIKTNKCYK